MKITFVMPKGGLSGGARVVAVYAGKLAERGHEVTVVWHRRGEPTRRQQLTALLKGRRLTAKQRSPYFEDLPVTERIASKPGPVRDSDVPDADVIVATWWETAFAVAALTPSKGEKFYFVQHHEVHGHLPTHLTRGSYHLPLHKITITGWLKDVMAGEYGDHDVDLVPNSVDLDLFKAPPRQKSNVPTVGVLYTPLPFKGLDVSLRAIEAARKAVPDLRVVAFGTRKPQRDLPLPPDSTFVWKPPQQDIRDLYARCDVWLMGSRSEGFGLPLLEAMACRTPVVSTRAGAAPDLIEDGVNGFVVDVEDSDTMSRRIVEILNLAPENWAVMSEAAWRKVQSYSWDDAATLFEQALLRRLAPDISWKTG